MDNGQKIFIILSKNDIDQNDFALCKKREFV